jgi:hypothetical protein
MENKGGEIAAESGAKRWICGKNGLGRETCRSKKGRGGLS